MFRSPFHDWLNNLMSGNAPAQPVAPPPQAPGQPTVPMLLGRPVTDYDPAKVAKLIVAIAKAGGTSAYGGPGGQATQPPAPVVTPPPVQQVPAIVPDYSGSLSGGVYGASSPNVAQMQMAATSGPISGYVAPPPQIAPDYSGSTSGGVYGATTGMDPLAGVGQGRPEVIPSNGPTTTPSAGPTYTPPAIVPPATDVPSQYVSGSVRDPNSQLAKVMMLKPDSDIRKSYDAYVSDGLTPQDAAQKAVADAGKPESWVPTPDEILHGAADVATTAGDVAGRVGHDLIHPGDAYGDVKHGLGVGLGSAFEVAGYLQHQGDLAVANYAYNKSQGNIPGWVDRAFTIADYNPASLAMRGMGADMFSWAQDHEAEVTAAYTQGYDVKDENGNVVEHIPPGPEAVVALYQHTHNFGQNLVHQIFTDPLSALPGVTKAGKVLQGVRAAEDAGPVARAAAAVGRTVGGALEVPGFLAGELPADIAKGTAGLVGRGVAETVGRIPGVTPAAKSVGGFFTELGPAAKQWALEAERAQTLRQVADSPVFQTLRDAKDWIRNNPIVEDAPVAPAARGAEAAATVTGDVAEKVGAANIVKSADDGLFHVTDDTGRPIVAQSAEAAPSAVAPAETGAATEAAARDAALAAPDAASVADPFAGTTLAGRPDKEIGFLKPKPDGGRGVDLIPNEPADVQGQFFKEYANLANDWLTKDRALDQAAKGLSGYDWLMNRAEKANEEMTFAKRSNELYARLTGNPEPAVQVAEKLAPIAEQARATQRSLAALASDTAAMDRSVGDSVQALTQKALSTDEAAARQVIDSLKAEPGTRAKQLGDQLETWRRDLYGEGAGGAPAGTSAEAPAVSAAGGSAAEVPVQPTTPAPATEAPTLYERAYELAGQGKGDVAAFEQRANAAIDEGDRRAAELFSAPASSDALRVTNRMAAVSAQVEAQNEASRIFAETMGEAAPPYARVYPAPDPALLRPANGAIDEGWLASATADPARADEINGLVETALMPHTYENDVAARDVRHFLQRQTGAAGQQNEGALLANALREERARLYPAADGVTTASGRAPSILDWQHHGEHWADRYLAEGKTITDVGPVEQAGTRQRFTLTFDDGSTVAIEKPPVKRDTAGAYKARQRYLDAMSPAPADAAAADAVPAARPLPEQIAEKQSQLDALKGKRSKAAIAERDRLQGELDALQAQPETAPIAPDSAPSDVRRAADAWQAGEYRQLMRGNHPGAAALRDYLSGRPPIESSLYRGESVPLFKARDLGAIGDTVDLPMLATTRTPSVGEWFSRGGMIVRPGEDVAQTFVEIRAGARGANLNELVDRVRYPEQDEVLTAPARYRIVDKEVAPPDPNFPTVKQRTRYVLEPVDPASLPSSASPPEPLYTAPKQRPSVPGELDNAAPPEPINVVGRPTMLPREAPRGANLGRGRTPRNWTAAQVALENPNLTPTDAAAEAIRRNTAAYPFGEPTPVASAGQASVLPGETTGSATTAATTPAGPTATVAAPRLQPEPTTWARETTAKPYADVWDQAKRARTVDEGAQKFADYAETTAGPRQNSVTTKAVRGRRVTVYEDTAQGKVWKRADAEAGQFRKDWATYRGDAENPNLLGGRPPAQPEGITVGPIPTLGGGYASARTLRAAESLRNGAHWTDVIRDAGDITDAEHGILNQLVEVGGKVEEDPATGKLIRVGGETKKLGDVWLEHALNDSVAESALTKTLADVAPLFDGARKGKVGFLVGLYKGINSFKREHAMFGQRGLVGIASDLIGDTFTQIQSGHWDTAIDSLNLRRQWALYKDLRSGATAVVEHSSLGDLLDNVAVAGRDMLGSSGRAETEWGSKMTARRVVERIARNAGMSSESANTWGGRVGELIASERLRTLREAGDLNRRLALYEVEFRKQLGTAVDGFRSTITSRAGDGVDAEKLIQGLGDEFSPGRVASLGEEAGFSGTEADRLARDWRNVLGEVDKAAFAEQNRVAFNFAATRADEALRIFFLFHTWQFRAAPLYARNALRNPTLMAFYAHVADALQKDAQNRGLLHKGYIQLWNTGTGQLGFMNPGYLISSVLINIEPDRWTSPDATMLDKVLAAVPASIAPAFQGIISAIGFSSNTAPDWLGMGIDNKAVLGIVNYGKAHGWWGDPNSLAPNLYAEVEQFPIRLGRAAVDWVTRGNVSPPTWLDPNRNDNQRIQARIRDLVYADYDVPAATDTVTLEQKYPEAADALRTALTSWQTGQPNDYANHAFRDYTSGNLPAVAVAPYVIPGGVVTASASNDALTVQRDLSPSADQRQGARGALDISRLGSPEATGLAFGQAAVTAATTDHQRWLMNGWNEISDGSNPQQYLYASTLELNGRKLTNADLAGLPTDQRMQIADAWAAALPGEQTTNLAAARAARDAAVAENPDEAKYRSWAKTARDSVGGEAGFRQDLYAHNENYRRYIDNYPAYAKSFTDRGDTAPTLDDYGISRDAYLAASGVRPATYSPNPAPTNATAPYPPSAMTGGAAAGGTTTTKDYAQTIADDYQKYQTKVAIFNGVLRQQTGNPMASLDGMNPELRSAWTWKLAQMGISEPQLPQSVQGYLLWQQVQDKNGKPSSVQDYAAFRDKIKAAGYDPDLLINAALSGYDPFSGTALGAYSQPGRNPYAGTYLGQ